ncbi:MFS transporter [Massilia putida]|uniref:MFS transporter n=1 Tax=Massilia putida TaxID=1141883 RepID=UPI000950E45A|nr:MFS transporter [Massilia putida]
MSSNQATRGTFALMLAHVAGLIDLVALPLWVGTLVQHYGLDFEHAGLTVTLFLLGAVGASVWSAPRFDRVPRRLCAAGGFAVSAAGLLMASRATAWPALVALHIVAGIGTGCGLSMAHGAMGRSGNPHRLFALAGTALGVFAVVFYALVPRLMATAGSPSLFVVMAGLMASAALASLGFPADQASGAGATRPSEPVRVPRAVWLLVTGVACLALNQSIIFSFLERIGMARGFGLDHVNSLLAAIGIVNLFPAPLSGFLQKRLPQVGVAIGATLVQVGLAFTISSSSSFAPYAMAASFYAFVIIFAHPFVFGLTARLDPSGRTNALTPAMLMIGSALAPAIAGIVAQRFGFAGLGMAVAGFGAIGVTCFALLGRGMKRSRAGQAPLTAAPAAD